MQIINTLYQEIKRALATALILLDIESRQPSEEESDILIDLLSRMGINEADQRGGSLIAVHARIKLLLEELQSEYYELKTLNGRVPSSVDEVLSVISEALEKRDNAIIKSYFGDNGLNDERLREVFQPIPDDKTIKSKNYQNLKSIFNQRVNASLELVEKDLDVDVIDKLSDNVDDLSLIEFVLQFFDVVGYEESTEMAATFLETKERLNTVVDAAVDGIEFFQSTLDGSLSDVSGTEAFLDTVKNNISKVVDMVKTALKTLLDFFTKRKQSSAEQIASIKETFQKDIDGLKSMKSTELTLDKDALNKTISMLEKADLETVAGYFKSVNDVGSAITAYTKAIADLEKMAGNTSEADKALSDAQKASDDLKNTPVNIDNNAPGEEKSALKTVVKEKSDAAKKALTDAKEKMKNALKPIAGMDKLTNTMSRVIKKVSGKSVEGTEAWMN